MSLRESTLAAEGPLLVSRPLKIPFLLDVDEMNQLFAELFKDYRTLTLYKVAGITPRGEEELPPAVFLTKYADYIQHLKNGETVDETLFRPYFSLFLSILDTILYAIPVESNVLVRATRPILQMQSHHLSYTQGEGEFRSLAYGQNTLSWGLQISYPTVYQDAKTQEVYDVKETPEFPNTAVFRSFQRWIRHNTLPTPFLVEGKKINVPARLGKSCFSWINRHPGLIAAGVRVDER